MINLEMTEITKVIGVESTFSLSYSRFAAQLVAFSFSAYVSAVDI